MDPRGGQNLLMHLDHLDPGRRTERPAQAAPVAVRARCDPRPLRSAGGWPAEPSHYMRTSNPQSPRCRRANRGHRGHHGRRFRQENLRRARFPRPATERATRTSAGAWPWWAMAMGEPVAAAGLPDVPFLVPISVDLRPKGSAGPIFGNWLAFHFARFTRSETADVVRLAKTLRRQMADANARTTDRRQCGGDGIPEVPHALDDAAISAGGLSGETFSFNCADILAFPPALETLFRSSGRELPTTPRPSFRGPASGSFFNRLLDQEQPRHLVDRRGSEEDDVTRIAEVVREGMGWAEVRELRRRGRGRRRRRTGRRGGAAGRGARTALVERYGFLGGMATAGMVSTICGLYRRRCPGSRSRSTRGSPRPSPGPDDHARLWEAVRRGRTYVLPYTPFAFACLADEFASSAPNLDVYLHATSWVSRPQTAASRRCASPPGSGSSS